ncbi:MAG: hypothetical protein U0414_17205 [Polyangiaceae bacterium]
MGHLGVTEVVLVLGLLGLIFAERIVRVFARWVARTKPTPAIDAGGAPTGADKSSEQTADAGS